MRYIILLFSLVLVANMSAQSFDLVWETKKTLKTPESVLFDANRNQIYVSNINGKPKVKDNNGFISLLRTDGSVRKLEWIRGMHAPKGMVLIDSTLYVTDIDRIHVVDISTDRIIKTIDVPGASFLNDIAALDNGNLVVSDMENNQLLLCDGSKAVVWMEDELLESPNGLNFFKGSLYVGTKNNILKADPEQKTLKVHISETGPVDGLIALGSNKFVVSDWSGRILIASPNEKTVLQNTASQNIQAADLGYIPDQKLVLIPTFFDNRIIARKLP